MTSRYRLDRPITTGGGYRNDDNDAGRSYGPPLPSTSDGGDGGADGAVSGAGARAAQQLCGKAGVEKTKVGWSCGAPRVLGAIYFLLIPPAAANVFILKMGLEMMGVTGESIIKVSLTITTQI